jgi:hypothetical protein
MFQTTFQDGLLHVWANHGLIKGDPSVQDRFEGGAVHGDQWVVDSLIYGLRG